MTITQGYLEVDEKIKTVVQPFTKEYKFQGSVLLKELDLEKLPTIGDAHYKLMFINAIIGMVLSTSSLEENGFLHLCSTGKIKKQVIL